MRMSKIEESPFPLVVYSMSLRLLLDGLEMSLVRRIENKVYLYL